MKRSFQFLAFSFQRSSGSPSAFRSPISGFRSHRQRGFALVLVLSFIVLLTAVVLAFLSNALLQRTVADSSANQTRADVFAQGAIDSIIGDLKQEIADGSLNGGTAVYTNGSAVIKTYTPATNSTVVPYRSGSDPSWTNLVKRSACGIPFYPLTNGYAAAGPSRAASNSSTAPSKNGRFYSPARWNKALLLPATSTNDLTPNTTKAFIPPDWVLVDRGGGNPTNWSTNLKWSTDASNTSPVIGRYAYAIYNEGGLLDANVAGYPGSLLTSNPNDVARKGVQSYADLTQIGLTSSQADALVNWRNNATLSGAATNYVSFVASNPTGFLKTANTGLAGGQSDRMFTSRKQLLDFFSKLNGGSTLQSALQYLGTFSRSWNAPSWEPEANASAWSGNNTGVVTVGTSTTTPALGASLPNAYAYQTNADTATSANRRIYNVRVKNPFTRLDGTPAIPGEPLIRNRFDLGRLAWIRYDGTTPAGITATDIYKYFGLTRNSDGSWTYYHDTVVPPGSVPAGGATRIKKLDEVANAGREPDFFELIQAGILQGSLGLCSGDPTKANDLNNGGEFYRANNISWRGGPIVRSDAAGLVYAQEKYQITQIGANMIDQGDADSFPTEVVLNGEHFYGVENLPYINAVADTALRPPPGGAISPNDYQAYVHRWLTISLWNPHQNAAIAPSNGPTAFRVFTDHGSEIPVVHNTISQIRQFPPWNLPKDFSVTNAWVAFNITDYPGRFAEPTTLDYDHTQVSDPNGRVQTGLGWKRAGIYMGWSYSPDRVEKVPLCAPVASDAPGGVLYDAANMTFSMPLILELQYQDVANPTVWHTYQELRGLVHTRDGAGDPYCEPNDPSWAATSATWNAAIASQYIHLASDREAWVSTFLDPRAIRLNLPSQRAVLGGVTVGIKLDQNYSSDDIAVSADVGPHFPLAAGLWKNWVNNTATNVSYYTDRDSVRRVGDAAGWTGADPQPAGSVSQRPLVLNRPFRSVGEIGYVFRDDPWKNLNLISANSADAALLDLFCAGPSPASKVPAPRVVAGKVDINAAPAPVLQALVAGAARDYQAADPTKVNTTITTPSDIQGIATDFSGKMKASPLANIADLPGLLPQSTNSTDSKYPGNKAQREAVVRALADSSTTRTWNLLIDMVAQSGKYGSGASGLNDFFVEGEAHYWVHVAIDRFTGEIVGQQLELISE